MSRFLFFVFVFASVSIYGQNYSVQGNAVALPGCNCFRLTQNIGNQGGAAYQNQTINLNNSFDFTFDLFFGCDDAGADGIAFVLTNNITGLGSAGGGLGYAGLAGNSFAVEFDTYQNGGEPAEDHIAFESGGSISHNVAGPVPALASGGNIEDCASHTARIVWNVNTGTFQVYFDGVLRLSITNPNFVNTYFGGNPVVNWGLSAATGGAMNEQRFCVLSNSNFTAGTNFQSCSKTVQFTDISTSNLGSVQSWAWNFGDGTTSSLQNPTHTYSANGTYNVTLVITDISGCSNTFTKALVVNPPITMTPTITQPLCNGGSNGSISVSSSGGFGASAGYGGYKYTWSNNTGTNTNIGLTAGTYAVTVTDGVCSATSQFTVNQPTPLSAVVNKVDASCGVNNGSVSITVSGGTTPYQFVSWPPVSGTSTATGLGAGTYVADFKDANGCSALQQYRAVVQTLPCGITSSVSSVNVTCFGLSNGSATLTVTGISGTATVTWSPGGFTGFNPTGMPAGTYTYNFSDANPAHAFSGTVTISQPGSAMVASMTTVNKSCATSTDGAALASVISGGTTPYSYSWSSGSPNNPQASNLNTGPISVTVTDFKGCTASASGNVAGPPAFSLNITTIPDSCHQAKKGSATVVATGGNGGYTYDWSNNAPGATNYNLGVGTYSVTVTDSKGCTVSASTSISEPPSMNRSLTAAMVLCYGNSTGSILVTPSGGNGGYTYTWSPALAGNNPTGLAAGTYYLTTADNKNCRLLDTIAITQPDSALKAVLTHKDISCFGANDGSLTLTVSGGTAPYNFLGNPVPAGTTTVPNLAPNTYAGNLTDFNNCSVALSQTITQPAALSVASKVQNPVSCFGTSTGSGHIVVNGGTRPYRYTWSPNVSTDSFANNLAAGTYIITVRDTNSCVIVDSIVITTPPVLSRTIAQTNVLCYGNSTGSILVTPSGGNGGYTYTWSPALAGNNPTGLAAGTYYLTTADNKNCRLLDTIAITQPDSALKAVLTHKDISCFGANDGSLTLTVSGGTAPYNFLGNPVPAGTTTVPNLAPNTYAGNLTDFNNCSVALSQTILEPSQLMVVSKNAIDVACYGDSTGSASIQISGGKLPYSYTWSPNVSTDSFATGLQNGTYIVTTRDSNLCSITDTIIINSQPQLTVLVVANQIKCFGETNGAIKVTPNGGTGNYNLAWNPAIYTGDSLTNLAANTYTLTITDNSLCTLDTSIVITAPLAALSFTQKDSVAVKCFGGNDGKIQTKVAGGTAPYSYTWSPNVSSSDSATNLTAGTYDLTVTDANNCSIATTIEITQPASIVAIDSMTKINVSCNGGNNGSATVFVSGGTPSYTYTWTPNVGAGSNVNNLQAGTYTVIATDNNGCTVTSSVNVTAPSAVTATSSQTDVKCHSGSDGTILINTSGGTPSSNGYTYTWSPNVSDSSSAVNLTAGNYAITVTDSLLCATTLAVTINEPASIIVNGVVVNATCYLATDGKITVSATGGASPYSYQISSDNGGTFTANASNVFSNLINQSYVIRVSDANSCSIDQAYVVTAPAPITAQFMNDSVSCFGDSDGAVRVINTTGGNGGYSYQLGATINTSGVFTNLSAGAYPVVISDSKNCTTTLNPVVGEPEELQLDIIATPSAAYQDSIVIKLGDVVQLNANTNYSNAVFQWMPSMGLSCDDCDNPLLATNYSVNYTVKATIIPVRKECVATKTLAVTVLKDYQLYIPNSFTPNGDGINDLYEIFGNKAIIKFWSFDLYNRWGEKVFESNDINFQWDGRYKGVPVSQGVYVYHLNVVFIDNHKETDLRGSITILK